MAQVLTACGADVDRELPWVKPWFERYQMQDGGLNCDELAYRVEGECPSSMVGTVAPFEAMLQLEPSHPFVERAARFMIERRISLGSPTVHNAEERGSAPAWRQVSFPRFYLYDVLRGVSALVRWASITQSTLPLHAISEVVDGLVTAFPDGVVRVQRRAFERTGTWREATPGTWQRVPHASSFPLLDVTSVIGEPSPALTREWTATRRSLRELSERGRLTV
jgi:hypothetical protein